MKTTDKPSFTAGPWNVNPGSTFTTVTSDERDICMMPAVVGRPYCEDEQDKANAALLASAPELYRALETLVADIKTHYLGDYFEKSIESATAALSRALNS